MHLIGDHQPHVAIDARSRVPTSVGLLRVVDAHGEPVRTGREMVGQIVAVLTVSYPFTATLVDSDTARQHLLESLAAMEAERTLGASAD